MSLELPPKSQQVSTDARSRRRSPWRAFAFALALGVAMPLTVIDRSFAASLQAEVEARQEKGFGRVVLTFKDRQLLPQFTTKQTNGVLVIEFTEPVEVGIETIATKLSSYVTVARRDPDGKALRIALSRQVKVNTIEAAEKLFVDFMPQNWAGPPPALPQEVIEQLAKRAAEAIRRAQEIELAKTGTRIPPKLDFKVGRLPTLTRFSFGWNVPFDTRMSRDGDRVSITFNRNSKIDLSPIDLEPVPGLVDVYSDNEADQLKVVFTVTPETDVRAFRDGGSYVLDILRGSKPGNAGEAMARKVLAPELPGRDHVLAQGRADLAAPATAPQPPAPPAKAAVTPAAPAASSAPATSAASTPVASSPPAAPPVPVATALPAIPPAPEPIEAPVRSATRDLTSEDALAPPPANPVAPSAPAGESGEVPAGEMPPSIAPKRAPTDTAAVRVEAKRIGDVTRVTFPFTQRVPAAAFKRDDTLWVVFDTAMDIDTTTIAPNLAAMSRGVEVMKSKTWQALRIDLTEPLLTTLSPDGNNWVLSVGEMVLEPAKPLKLRRFVRSDGNASLKVDLTEGGAVHEFVDPKIGDRIVVVTAQAPSRGLSKPQSFVDVATLTSAHGVAVLPRSDDVQVMLENDEVTIGRERGLNLSTGQTEDRSFAVPRSQATLHHVPYDPTIFDKVGAAGYEARAREMQRTILENKDQAKRQARVDLAEYYIGQRFAPEALAQLRMLADEEPGIVREPGFIVLFGAGQVLAGRAKQGKEALGRSEVTESADAALWRTIASVDLAKWDEARENALRSTGVLGTYPKTIQSLFNLAAGEAAIELGDIGLAETRLAEIEPELLARDLVGRYEILEARLADIAGRPEDATNRYERAVATGDRRTQADAEFRLIKMGLRDKKIDKEEAIERLRSLSFGWRGDEIELRTLRELAGLLADTGRYREAFQAMRSALQVAPDAATTRLLQDEMSRRFLALYLDDADKALSPIEALTLYYDFRELVPIGRRGDEVVRKLADRLVGIDLLPQAAELLTYQVDNRLKGAARAQIAADLAVVHLLDRKPDKALAVLNKTRQSQLPVSLDRQRRLVEVRALADAGRPETALELLSSLSGNDATRLRADVLWKAKRWREAGERLEAMLGTRWQDQTPLDDQERQDVLRVAIGYSLANDQLSLDRLRTKYGPKMADSPNAHTFDLVTRPIQTQGTEFREVAREIAQIDTLRQFLKEYRAQYLDPKARTVEPEAVKPGAKLEAPQKPEPSKAVASADPAQTASPTPNKGGH